MAANAQHENVGAGAKHFFFGAGHHHGTHFGVLKADAIDRIIELNVYAQVVTVQLELVAGTQTCVFINVNSECRHGTIERQFPMFVGRWVGLVFNLQCFSHLISPFMHNSA